MYDVIVKDVCVDVDVVGVCVGDFGFGEDA